MFPINDQAEVKKLHFFLTFTCIYSLFIVILNYSSNMQTFRLTLIIIGIAEAVKHLIGETYFNGDHNVFKKQGYPFTSYFIGLFRVSSIKHLCKNILTVIVMIMVYFLVSVLYGAEVFGSHEETLTFSTLLAILTVFPACLNLGPFSVINILLGCKPTKRLEGLMYQNMYITLFGAWIGAFVIPLDWDRPWQKWPIPCCYGALLGYFLSHALLLFNGKYTLRKKVKF